MKYKEYVLTIERLEIIVSGLKYRLHSMEIIYELGIIRSLPFFYSIYPPPIRLQVNKNYSWR